MSLHVRPTFWNDVRYRVQLAGGLWGEDLRDRGSSFKETAFERAVCLKVRPSVQGAHL